MIDIKELDEAHKVGDKVVIKHPSKDIKGKTGRIGEIRKGLYKGAPKTFTVDYDHNETTGQAKSVQLKSKHIQGVKEQVENLQEKHRVAITLSDPHHPAVTKRKELIQKTVRVKADNPGHAVDSAIHHFRRAGYKVHDHHYIGTVKEGAMPTFKELDEGALETFRKAAAEREKEANKREAEMKARHAAGKEDMKGAIDTLAKRLNKEEVELEEGLGRGREDDEYHTPDPVKHTYKFTVSKDGGEKHDRTVTTGLTTKSKQELHSVAKAHLEKQGYKIHESVVNESAPFKKLDHAVAYATDKVKTHRDNLDGIEVYKHKSGGYDVNHTMNSSGRDSLHKSGAKHLGTVYKDKPANIKEDLEEGRGAADKHWDIAQGHKEKASLATKGTEKYHSHMADYHDSMHRYHSDIGQTSHASAHADKAEIHHEKAYEASRANEEVAANNVGGGAIAGTQGDAGKKSVMTKKPLKRQTFKEYAIDAKGHKSSTGGLTQKGVDAYNRKTGGNLQTAVTTPPSKLDPDSKAAKRRKSFCARMGGMPGPMKDEKGRPTRKALALRKWNC